jgi:hypothetical protein
MASQRDALKSIRTFPQLIKFLRDELTQLSLLEL